MACGIDLLYQISPRHAGSLIRRLQIPPLFDSPLLRRVGHCFDTFSALAGLAVLVILGPLSLYQVLTTRIPIKEELTLVEGTATKCAPDIRGALVGIAGYERSFRSQLDSCGKVTMEGSGHLVRVSVYVAAAAELNGGRRRGVIASFGLIADGEVVHERDADLTAASLDRVVLTMEQQDLADPPESCAVKRSASARVKYALGSCRRLPLAV